MPKVVEIKGRGMRVSFPDSMSTEAISEYLRGYFKEVPEAEESLKLPGVETLTGQPKPREISKPGAITYGPYGMYPTEYPMGEEFPELVKGLKSSIPGMLVRQKPPVPSEAKSLYERESYIVGQYLGDFPFYVAGGALGGLGTYGIGAYPGAFALTAGVRKVLIDAYNKGDAKTWGDTLDRVVGAAYETAKGAFVGKAVGIAGKYAPEAAKLPAQAATMATVGPLAEGELPTFQGFLDSAIFIFGLNGAMKGVGILKGHYAKTGERPRAVAQKVEQGVDPASFISDWAAGAGIAARRGPGRGQVSLPSAKAKPSKAPLFKPTSQAAKAVVKMYEKSEVEVKAVRTKTLTQRSRAFRRITYDTSANVKRKLLSDFGEEGKLAVIRHDLIKGASPKAESMYNRLLPKIYGGLSRADEVLLNRVIQSRRTIAIEKYKPKVVHPEGLGAREHEAFLKSMPESKRALINSKADAYFNVMREQLVALRNEGLISESLYEALAKRGDYSPRRFIQYIDPEVTYGFGGKKITVHDSGIKALDKGSTRALEGDSRLLLLDVISRTQRRVFKNRANKVLHDLATKQPDNEFVKMLPEGEKAPAGRAGISVMIDGVPKRMSLPNEIAREWVTADPQVSVNIANTISWLSGSKILKASATGYNPGFAVSNFPRDIIHIWLTTSEYSKHGPVAGYQMGRNLASTAKDAFTHKGAWFDYIDEGGSMQYLTHQGLLKPTRGLSAPVRKLQIAASYLGEVSEVWNRLALRKQALRNGRTAEEATWIARNYLDFAQGGSYAKAADTAMPYLNAGIQASTGLVKSAAREPGAFAYKSGQLATLAMGLVLANRHVNRDCWDSISDGEKTRNFIITTPFEYNDRFDNKRYMYFAIAKDQGQRIISTIFENLVAKSLGEDISVDQIAEAAKDFVPIIPGENMPPSLDAMLGYVYNVDFWRNEDIWEEGRGPIEPSQEFTQYTHPALVKFGEETGLSPERSRYILTQLFTYRNIYTDIVSGGLRKMFDEMEEEDKEKSMHELLSNVPIIRRVYKSTRPLTRYEKGIEETEVEENTRLYIQNREFYEVVNAFYDGKVEMSGVDEFIKTQPPQDRKRLYGNFKSYKRIHNLPDRSWWMAMKALPPEGRATVFWLRYKDASPEGKERLDKYLPIVPGVTSERFMIKLRELKRAGKVAPAKTRVPPR